jgi:hypothetical protein
MHFWILGTAFVSPSCVKPNISNLITIELSTLSHRDQLARLINTADELSLPFCKLEVQYLLSSESESSADEESKEKLASALFDAVTRAVDDNHLVWLELIQSLESDMLLKVSGLDEIPSTKMADHP